jgi:hypothetical protein
MGGMTVYSVFPSSSLAYTIEKLLASKLCRISSAK